MNWALITTELVWSASSTGNIKRPLKLGENTRKALSCDRMCSQFLEFFSVKFTVLDKRPHKYALGFWSQTSEINKPQQQLQSNLSITASPRAKVTTKVEVTRKVIGAKVTQGAIVARWRWQEVKITVNVSAETKNVASAICNIAVEPDYRGR